MRQVRDVLTFTIIAKGETNKVCLRTVFCATCKVVTIVLSINKSAIFSYFNNV